MNIVKLTMNESEKIKIIDAFLKALDASKTTGMIPELLDNKPGVGLDKLIEKKYRIIEYEIERLQLVNLIEGKDGSTTGNFGYYSLAPKGLELLINNASCQVLYDAENKQKQKEDMEFKLKRMQSKTFWIFFILSIIGGILGIITFMLKMLEPSVPC